MRTKRPSNRPLFSRLLGLVPPAPHLGPAFVLALLLGLGAGQARAQNTAPTITTIADQALDEDTSSPPIPFTLGDAQSPASSLSLVATTDNPGLIPVASIAFGGSGASRTLTLRPAANRFGIARVRVRVTDPSGGTSSTLFTLTVHPVNDAPTLSPIPGQTTTEDTPTAAIPFTIRDMETAPEALSLVATTDNPSLIPLSGIVFGGSGSSRTATLTPARNRFGSARVRVRVTDPSGGTNSVVFTFTVTAVNDAPMITPIANRTLAMGGNATIPFTIGDAETAADSLGLAATTSNPVLLPASAFSFSGTGSTRSLRVAPYPGRTGTANVRVRVTDAEGAVASTLFTVTVEAGATIRFTTEGEAFAPRLTLRAAAQVRWTFADGTTSADLAPVKHYGSPGSRTCFLSVSPWSALQRINLGYDAGDGGSGDIEAVPDQHVSAVQGLELVAPTLGQWCSSYNQITALDFSNFLQLDTIECFLSQSLSSVNLENTPALRRACFEDCNLASLDLSQSPALEDLRGAVNAYPTIAFGTTGSQVWHICVRDNPQITTPNLFADLTPFPRIAELFIWNDNQSGGLRIPSTHPTAGVSIQADGNHYASLDLRGALRNPSAPGAVCLRGNQITDVNLEGCVQISELHLENNAIGSAAVDALLAAMDAMGRDRTGTPSWIPLEINLAGNGAPSSTGYAHGLSLAAKGWTVTATGWTLVPTGPPDTGPARIDFSTTGDLAQMRCDFVELPEATWHWSDGTTTAASTGAAAIKSGLGQGLHAHHLTISNGSALTRFGAIDGGGQGHLASVSGLNNAPLLSVLYLYAEGALTSIGRVNATRIREFHLMGTALDAADMDQVFADAAESGALNGTLWCPNLGTAASDAARTTLLSRGWTLNN